MSSEKPMKLTCHGATKRNAYILPSRYFFDLRNTIVLYLFGSSGANKQDFRVYWIDEDNDEIEIVNQDDYEIFRNSCKDRLHLYAETNNMDGNNGQTGPSSKAQVDGMFPTTAVHHHVECDNCLKKPLVGFRYKCVECQDYDLCQNCEAWHIHDNHMMIRMPHGDCPNVIEAWVTGRSKRSHKRGGRSTCPIVSGAAEIPSTAAPGGGDSERHHRRSHRRREFNTGVFGHLYKMMVDLAEGGVQVNDEAAAAAESAVAAASAATTAAMAATSAAADVASNTARVAAETCANISVKAADSTEKKESKIEQTKNTGAKPKSPQPTPNTGTANNSEPNSVPLSPSLENLARFIHPQYMRNGIETLNNLNEMFAKLLLPEDIVRLTCPFNTTTDKDIRKNSSTSVDSNNSKRTSINGEQPNARSQAPIEKEQEIERPSSTVETPTDSLAAASPDRCRSQSLEDNDWLVIDQQTTTVGMESVETASAKPVDFAQLSKDLKAHIEDEQKRQEQSQQPLQPKASATQTPNAQATISTSTVITDAPSAPPASQSAPKSITPLKISDEKRGVLFYHDDPRVNNAVYAMIAMGFSNEGAWLTQLLESVNGSIPDALELMNAAQRNNN